ncbi:MAG: pyridoxamine 5'-phosphate oxidase family protein [Deltaproteobacteria bacterium]|nr:pyridoxamine 5'-phosphate oxidase family protein [Deltaproteobacteria bacterium]
MNETVKKVKALLASHITKNTMPRQELEKQIFAFLDEAGSRPGTTDKPGCCLKHGLACVLCTVHDGEPRATPIDFFVDGFTLWHAGEPGLKIRNIRSNAKVAVGVYHPVDHSVLNRSLQINGTATLVPYAGHEQEFIERLKIMGVYAAATKVMKEMFTAQGKALDTFDEDLINALRRFNLIKIEPYEITYLRIHPTEGTVKNIWKKTTAEAS